MTTRAPRAPLGPGRLMGVLSALAALTLVSAAIAAALGADPLELGAALGEPGSTARTILVDHRLPRVIQGLLVGAVLGAAGAVLQGLLRNALADPYLLGVSGGAALGASLVALTPLAAALAEPLGGFLGALAALIVVTALATRRGRIAPLDVLLVGVLVNAIAGAALTVLQAVGDPRAVHRVLLRLMGTLTHDPGQPLLLPAMLATSAVGLGAVFTALRKLDLLALGDDTARSLGVDPERLRWVLFIALSLPVGAVVATSGLIGFVGLLVPHAVRFVTGPDHRLLVPASALAGATLLVLADAFVRVLSGPLGTELPVGVVTTAVGGPVFLVLLRRSRGGAA